MVRFRYSGQSHAGESDPGMKPEGIDPACGDRNTNVLSSAAYRTNQGNHIRLQRQARRSIASASPAPHASTASARSAVAQPLRIHFPRHERPRASIVIVAWRQQAPLMACLQALSNYLNDRVPYEVIVVLNDTARAKVEDAVRGTVSGATLMKAAVNLGFGGGCNLGATVARGEYVVLLNDDARVEPGWLDWLVHTADANPTPARWQLLVVSRRQRSGGGVGHLAGRIHDACGRGSGGDS